MRGWILVILLFSPFLGFSQGTNVSGNLIDNDTWTIAGSPYNIVGDVGVPSAYSLTIEPGVVVNYTGDFRILVLGSIMVDGLQANPVTFNGNSVEGSNYMIELRRTNLANSHINYASFMGPQAALKEGEAGDTPENTGTLQVLGSDFLLADIRGYPSVTNPGVEPVLSFTNSSFSEVEFWSDEFIYSPSEVTYHSLVLDNCELRDIFTVSGHSVLMTNSRASFFRVWGSPAFKVANSFLDSGIFNNDNKILFIENSILVDSWLESEEISLQNVVMSGLADGKNAMVEPNDNFGSTYSILNSSFNGDQTQHGILPNLTEAQQLVISNSTFNQLDVALKLVAGNLSVSNSNFLNNATYHIENTISNPITTQGNYWDSDSPTIIADKIFDENDDLTLGLVDITNRLSTYSTAAPISLPEDVQVSDDGAGGVDITWQANGESDLAGYKIYYRANSGAGGSVLPDHWYFAEHTVIDAGNVTTYNLPGLSLTDSIAVTAYDIGVDGVMDMTDGNESWYSFAARLVSSETDFLTFSHPELVSGSLVIDEPNHSIDLVVNSGTDLTSLIPTFTLSPGASAEVGGVPQVSGVTANDFTNTVVYRVTAEDGITTQDWVVSITIASSTATDITSFTLPEQAAEAVLNSSNHTVAIEVVNGTSLNNLTPTITTSPGASINPLSGLAQDFTAPVTYTVTAEDGVTSQDWLITVSQASSIANDITSFVLPEQITTAEINFSNHTVTIAVAKGTDLTNLTPTITISSGSSINPLSGVARDFSSPVIYTITAEDGVSTQDWTVTVTLDDRFIAYYPFNGNANDESGNGYNGAENGGVALTADRFGNVNSAFSFDGVDDNIFVAGIPIVQEFTVSSWFRTDVTNRRMNMVDLENFLGLSTEVGGDSTAAVLRKSVGEFVGLTAQTFPTDNNWHLSAATYDGITLRLYFDGILVGSRAINSIYHDKDPMILRIGSILGDFWWNGAVDDVHLFNLALSEAEIKSLYTENGWNEDYLAPIVSNQNLPSFMPFGTDGSAGSVAASVDINDNIGLVAASFHAKRTDQVDWNVTDLPISAQGEYSVSITKSQVGETGLQYFFSGEDAKGNKASTDTVTITYQYAAENSPIIPNLVSGGTESDWRMFSIPYKLSDNRIATIFEAKIGAYNKQDWRLLHYDQTFSETNFREYKNGLETIDQGKGYWFNSLSEVNLRVGTASIEKFTMDSPASIELVAGWNQIGNPYTFDVLWQDVLTANGLTTGDLEPLRVYNGGAGLENETILQSFAGAYVHSDQARQLIIPFQQNSGGRLSSRDDFAEGWLVQLDLQAGRYGNKLSGFGMHPEAIPDHDGYDRIRVPRFTSYIDASFEHSEYISSNFGRDVVSELENYTWEFTVSSNVNDPIRNIEWSIINTPEAKELILIDLTTGRVTDMLDATNYSYSGQADRAFKAIYGEKAYIVEQLAENTISLGHNYPNPFSNKTIIPYSIYGSESEYEFSIKVYSISGQMVNQLISDKKPAGSYQLEWDARDDTGKRLKGLFIYSLEVNTPEGIKTFRNKLIVR